MLIVGLMAFEVVAGIIAHSLALLSDAGHMLTDAGALVLSLVVIRLAQRPAGGSLTYGMRRAEVLSGQANGAVLLVLGVLVTYEGISRLVSPPHVAGGLVTIVAALGVVVNLVAAWVLAKANRESLNVEGSFQHIVTDLYAFIGTLVAGIVIIVTGFDRADAIASLVVAGLMVRSGYSLQRKAVRVLLESAPENTAPNEVGRAMAHTASVSQVHDLHLWELAPGRSDTHGARTRRAGRRLPCDPARTRTDASTALRHRAHGAPGRPCAATAALDRTPTVNALAVAVSKGQRTHTARDGDGLNRIAGNFNAGDLRCERGVTGIQQLGRGLSTPKRS